MSVNSFRNVTCGVGQHVNGPVHRGGSHARTLEQIRDGGLVLARRPLRHHGDEVGAVMRKFVRAHRSGEGGVVGVGAQ